MADEVTELGDLPLRVSRAAVEGLVKTRDYVAVRQIQRSALLKSQQLSELLSGIVAARSNLSRLDIFSEITTILDVDKSGDPDSFEVTFMVKEKAKLTGNVATEVGSESSAVKLGARSPNLTGRADSVLVDYQLGTKESSGFNTTYSIPLDAHPNYVVSGGVFAHRMGHLWAGYRQREIGVFSTYARPLLTHWSQTLRLEHVVRTVSAAVASTPAEIRWQEGCTSKTSAGVTLTRDTRDSPSLPATGSLFRTHLEAAGLVGDSKFWRCENEGQVYCSYSPFTLGLCYRVGCIASFDDSDVRLCDRLFVGGPMNLRGFSLKGVGPSTVRGRYSLGATSFWLGGAHLYSQLPFLDSSAGTFANNFRLHGFLNSGAAFNGDLLQAPLRLSVGTGIVMNFAGSLRLELNYSWVLRSCSSDVLRPGLQFGVGIDFV